MNYIKFHNSISSIKSTIIVNWMRKQKINVIKIVFNTIVLILKTFFCWIFHCKKLGITFEEHVIDCFNIEFFRVYEKLNKELK